MVVLSETRKKWHAFSSPLTLSIYTSFFFLLLLFLSLVFLVRATWHVGSYFPPPGLEPRLPAVGTIREVSTLDFEGSPW